MKGIWKILQSIFKFVQGLGTFTLGTLVILLLGVMVLATRPAERPSVEDGAVLVLWPEGVIVEQTKLPDPYEVLFDRYNSRPAETSVHSILTALERAAYDDRISALAILTDNMAGATPAHAHAIADAVKNFKATGKAVYAVSSGYSQSDYMIAAEADTIYMNPHGSVLLQGYGAYGTYFKSLLDKIGANVNVFRVGTYKAAVEPFLRDDMSPAAKEANLTYLNDLWGQYESRVTEARGLDAGALTADAANINEHLRGVGGDLAKLAVDRRLVDKLEPRANWRRALMEKHGTTPDGSSFKQIHYQNYLAATGNGSSSRNSIAVITAQGELVMGEGPQNVAAAETLVRYIRNARNNGNTKAIVLRVDSPGGSSFASELIRQELAIAQADGIPVIASMGPVAASGGYWISATADEIWAAPSTITGSIGIFGVIPTFETTLEKIGVHTDGVGSTALAGAFDTRRNLSDNTKDMIQQFIENGYQQFLELVATGRNMSTEDVDKIAQGRVWIGSTAKDLGLVDHLGGFDDAVAAAARAAGLEEGDYNTTFYRESMDPIDNFLMQLLNSDVAIDHLPKPAPSPMMKLMAEIEKNAGFLMNFNDPLGSYALCLTCKAR